MRRMRSPTVHRRVRAAKLIAAAPTRPERPAVNTNRHPDPHPWPLYEAARDALIELVVTLDDSVAGRTVPLTPGWTITEVMSHVCGLNSDVADGMRVGLGTPERTRPQVEVRVGRSPAEIGDEWRSHADAMRQAMHDDSFFGHRLLADLVVHLHDVQHALDLHVERDGEATRAAAHTYGSVVTDLLLERSGVSLRVELDDGTVFSPSDESAPHLTLRTSPFDYLRTVTARRSAAEALALDWVGDATAVLEQLSPYGPLRDIDARF
jgi:hypothetical protein